MNIERWLQARREGRLSAIPLGMQKAIAASSDVNTPFDMFLDGHGNGLGHMYGPYGAEYLSGNGQDESFLGNKGDNKTGDNFSGYFENGHGCGNGLYYLHELMRPSPCLTQRFQKDKS